MKKKKSEIELEKESCEKSNEKQLISIKDSTTDQSMQKSENDRLLTTRIDSEQRELLTESSNILMQDQLEPDNLAIQSMKQLNYVLQRLTKTSQQKIEQNEEVLREELPFSMANDLKKITESIGILMKNLNESRKIRTTTYLKLKELNRQSGKNEQ